MNLSEGFLPEMKRKEKSRIVIISSIAAITPMPKSSIYASAKSAIYSYGLSLSQELKEDGMSVTVSLPGYVRTDIHEKAVIFVGEVEEKYREMKLRNSEEVYKYL